MEAEKNLDLLKGVGLIKLTIGYYTIWDRFTRDKEVAELEKEVALVKGRFTKDNKVALLEEMELAKQLLQEKEREIDSMKSLLEENKVSTSERRVSQDQQSSIECLSEPELRMRLEVESKISKAKTLQLTRHKEMTAILTVQLRERDEKISQLMEKVKALQSQMLVLHSSLEHNDPELNQRCEDKVTRQQDSTNLHSMPSQKKLSSYHRMDDTSEDFSLDHEMKGNVKWHDTGVDLISPTTKQSEHVINKLKKQQQAKNQWWMYLWLSPPNSSLLVFSNLNDCPLWRLEIYNTTLDSRCLFELSYALTYNKTLEICRLYSSPLTPSGIKLISNAVSTNTTLKTLGLWYDNTVTDEDIPHLGIMLSVNATLEQFYLYACHNVTDVGKKYLAEALTNNKTLTTLYINDFYLC